VVIISRAGFTTGFAFAVEQANKVCMSRCVKSVVAGNNFNAQHNPVDLTQRLITYASFLELSDNLAYCGTWQMCVANCKRQHNSSSVSFSTEVLESEFIKIRVLISAVEEYRSVCASMNDVLFLCTILREYIGHFLTVHRYRSLIVLVAF